MRKHNYLTGFAALAAFAGLCIPDTARAQTLTFSPNAVNLNISAPGGTASTPVSVSSSAGISGGVTATSINTSDHTNWLCAVGSGSTLTVSVGTGCGTSSNQLATNQTYTGQIVVSAPSQSNGNVTGTLNVTLQVGASSGSGLTATPNPVTFNVQTGVTPPSQNVNLTLNGGSVTVQSVSATTTTGQQWLLPSVGSSSVFVSIQPSGLTAGNYSGTVTANTSGGAVSFPVNLTVAAAPTVSVTPSALNFAFQTGTTAPLSQTITLNSPSAANVSVSSSTSSGGTQWLIVTPTGQQTTPTQITVNIQPAGLAAGTTYNGNIQIVTSGGAANGTVNVPVSLLVSNNPIIAANPASLTFTTQVGNAAPAQNLSLTSSGTPLSYSVTSSVGSPTGGNWLQVPSQTGTTSGAISVGVNTAGLAVGTYIGAINVSAANAGNGNLSIPVTLNITAGPALQLSAPNLSFAFQTGQAQPLSQTVTVSSSSGQVGYTVAAQTSTGGQWLSASPTTGTAPGNFVVSVNTTGLAAGTYNGSISVTPSGANSIPQTIQVSLVVSNTPLLVLSPSNIPFTATAGSGASSFQNVAVTSTDGTPLNFSVGVATTTGSNWLLVNTSSATTPANLSISANPSGLGVGTYTGTVTITGPASVGNSPQVVHVTLNVTSTNALSASPASLSFSQSVNGSAPAAQTLNITSTGASSGSQITFAASVALNQGQNWLTVSPLNATTPAPLTVTANGAGLAAGTYTGQIILSSPGVANQTVNVTLTVGSGGNGGGLNFAGSLAHLAVGGGWKTTFTFVNNGTTTGQVHVNLFDDNGNPLALAFTFPQVSATANAPASSLDRTINPGATLLVDATGPDNQPTQVGWAQVSTSGNVGAFGVFRQSLPSGAIPEAVVQLETRNSGSYVLAFDSTNGYLTGLALANIALQSATVNIIIRDDNGTVLQTAGVNIAALGHTSFVLDSRYPVAAQRRGTIEVQTPAGGQISVIGLRFSPTTAFTTIPPLAK